MAPHLTAQELDQIQAKGAAGWTPAEVHSWISARRARKGILAPNITNIRKALKGNTYRRGITETRGRKRALSAHVVRHMNQTRRSLIRTAGGNREVRWKDVIRKSRAPKVHRSTALRAFRRAKINVAARRPRAKPQRTKAQAAARVEACQVLSARCPAYFSRVVDLIIDNKRFELPTHERARQYLKSQRVRFHLRTPSETTSSLRSASTPPACAAPPT